MPCFLRNTSRQCAFVAIIYTKYPHKLCKNHGVAQTRTVKKWEEKEREMVYLCREDVIVIRLLISTSRGKVCVSIKCRWIVCNRPGAERRLECVEELGNGGKINVVSQSV